MGKTDPTRKTALDQLRARLISKKFGGTPPKIKQKKAKVVEFDFTPYPGQVIPYESPQHIEILRQLIEAEGKLGLGDLQTAVNMVGLRYQVRIDIIHYTGGDYTEVRVYEAGGFVEMRISKTEELVLTTAQLVDKIVKEFNLRGEGGTIQSEPNKTESWTEKWLRENTSQK